MAYKINTEEGAPYVNLSLEVKEDTEDIRALYLVENNTHMLLGTVDIGQPLSKIKITRPKTPSKVFWNVVQLIHKQIIAFGKANPEGEIYAVDTYVVPISGKSEDSVLSQIFVTS